MRWRLRIKRPVHRGKVHLRTSLLPSGLMRGRFVGVWLAGGGPRTVALSVAIAIMLVLAVLSVAVRYGHTLSRFAAHESDEIILLTILGTILLVAGIAQSFRVLAAIGAFLGKDRGLMRRCRRSYGHGEARSCRGLDELFAARVSTDRKAGFPNSCLAE